MISLAVGVLAVDQLGLLRMEHQATFAEPAVQHLTKRQGLAFGTAVTDDVIGIPFERYPWHLPLQPDVEHVVQEQVSQEWVDHPSLRCSPVPLHKTAIL